MTSSPFNNRLTSSRPYNNTGNKPYYRKDGGKNYIRKNEKIRAQEVRVIDHDGKQLGVMTTSSAILLAKNKGLDLIEISPNTQPPVCKILDFGKFKYDESKKDKQNTKSQSTKIKEIKLRMTTDQNDYKTKIRHAIDFLGKGNKLKISLMFRGRELAHSELGFDVIKRFITDLNEYGTVDSEPKLFGKIISTTISPLSTQKKPTQKSTQSVKILDASELLKL